MELAVIKTGGKQYIVEPGKKIQVEKIRGEAGDIVVFDHVLLVANDANMSVGMPMVPGARVEAKLLQQGRAKKVIVFKYRPKARMRKKKGHRQPYSEIEVNKIITG